jgi:hypothetical protein
MLRHAGKMAAGMLSAGLVAGLGLPTLGALVFLAVLVLGVTCWVIGSDDRANRVTRIMLARRGDARCLEPGASAPSPASQQRRQTTRSAK